MLRAQKKNLQRSRDASPLSMGRGFLRRAPHVYAIILTFITATLFLWLTLASPGPRTFDVGTADDTWFSWGFFDPETDGQNAYRWSGPETQIVLHGAGGGPAQMDVRLYGNQFADAEGRSLRLRSAAPINGELQTFAQFDVQPGWRVYHLIVPETAVRKGVSPRALALVADLTRPGPNDRRLLGVAVDWVRVAPLAHSAAGHLALIARAASLVWGPALLAAALWLADRRIIRGRRRWAMARVGTIVGLTYAALLFWAWRDPYAPAYALPPAPWALGTLTVLLIVVAATTRAATGAPKTQPGMSHAYAIWVGLGLLLVAQVLFSRHWFIGAGILLALVGIVLLWRGGLGYGDDVQSYHRPLRALRGEKERRGSFDARVLALVLIFVIALALRFHLLQELPYGLWRDEARHGLVALRMLEDPDYRPVYVKADGVDMPALGLYPFALAIKLWGLYPWSMVPITALAGALTVFPIYGVAYQLFRRKDVALLAAAFLAGSSWHLTISRFSFPTIFDPLFGLTGLWLMLWSQGAGGRGQGAGVTGLSSSVLRPPSSVVRPPSSVLRPPSSVLRPSSSVLRPPSSVLRPSSSVIRLVACFVSGGCIGVALQTYHTGRVVPLIAGILAVCLLVQQRHQWRRWLASMAMVALGFAIVTGPLALHVLNDPNAVNERVSDVFLLSDAARAGRAPLALLDEAIGRHLLMFNVQGDANGRHHAPGRPMLDFITGFGFLIGVTVVARRWRDWRGLFLLAGLGISMLPSALAVDAPHAMRSFGAVAFACIIAALGWAEVWRLMSRANAATSLRRTTNDERRTSRVYVNQEYDKNASQEGVHLLRSAIGMIALALALNYWTYFVEMRFSPTVWTMFYPIHTQMGVYLRAVADEQGPEALRRVYVPEGFADNSVFQYLTHGLPVQTYRNVNVPESAKTGAILLLSGYSYERDAQELMQYIGPQPTPTARGPNLPGIDTPAFVGYETQPIAAGE